MVFGFGCKEDGGFENGGWVVSHEGVGGIEAFYVLDCCCLQNVSLFAM